LRRESAKRASTRRRCWIGISNTSNEEGRHEVRRTSRRSRGDSWEKLEAAELPLEEALALFEKGIALVRQLATQLDEVERKLEVLTRNAAGEPALREMKSRKRGDDDYLRGRAARVDRALAERMAERRSSVEPRLLEAMEYSLSSPGKRLRPILVLASAEALGADAEPLVPFACASRWFTPIR